jgi:HlyD family secretion protein
MQSSVFEEPLVISPEIRRGAIRRRWLALAMGLSVIAALAVALVVRAKPEPIRYATAVIERRTLTRLVEATGSLDVLQRVEVPALVSGQLVSVLVRAGQRVEQGQSLAILDGRAGTTAARVAQATVNASSGKVAEALAALAAATEARQRTDKLKSRELASESDVEAARSRESRARAVLATTRAERSQALESLRSARVSESSAIITAPISGVVLEAPATSGGTVSPERGTLFVLGSGLETLRVQAEVAESEIGELAPGQVARFSVPAHPGRLFDAVVEYVGIDARRTAVAVRYPVELHAPNPGGALLPGMTATVQIAVARAENALVARDATLRFQPEGARDAPARSRVWRVRPSGLEEVRISAGLSDGAFTEIRAEPPGALAVGVELALGVLDAGQPKANGGPGIRLGSR